MYRNKAADLALSPENVDEAYIKSAKALLVSGTALAESPSREAALKAMALAKKHQVKLIFDIDYRAYNWKSEDEVGLYYAAAAQESQIIMGSREEFDLAERFTGLDGTDRASADYWMDRGARIVVIKHGKQGSAAYTYDGKTYNIKPFPVKALKSFGGGDGYGSSFINGLLEGWDIMDCLEYGSASAAMLVASHGCSDDMPGLEAISKFIREEKQVYGEMIARG